MPLETPAPSPSTPVRGGQRACRNQCFTATGAAAIPSKSARISGGSAMPGGQVLAEVGDRRRAGDQSADTSNCTRLGYRSQILKPVTRNDRKGVLTVEDSLSWC